MQGEREVPGPAAGLQAGPREGAQREGAAEAWGQAEEERERGEEVRHGVLRRRHQVREVKVSMRQHFTLEDHLCSFEDYHDSLFSQLQYPRSVIKSNFIYNITFRYCQSSALHCIFWTQGTGKCKTGEKYR